MKTMPVWILLMLMTLGCAQLGGEKPEPLDIVAYTLATVKDVAVMTAKAQSEGAISAETAEHIKEQLKSVVKATKFAVNAHGDVDFDLMTKAQGYLLAVKSALTQAMAGDLEELRI